MLVKSAHSIRENVRVFEHLAGQYRERASSLIASTLYWVFDTATGNFGPGKFVGQEKADFEDYERRYSSGPEQGSPNGTQTRLAIEGILGEFHKDEQLEPRLLEWLSARGFAEESKGVNPEKWRFAHLGPFPFIVNHQYTRMDVQRLLGLEPATGGNWFTGYHQHAGEWYLFPNINTAGRTGHDYGNQWIDGRLRWYGKTGSRLGQPVIQSMLSNEARVHLFTREHDRDPFTYHGLVRAAQSRDVTPVEIVWQLEEVGGAPDFVPQGDESAFRAGDDSEADFFEGKQRVVLVNAFERSRAAREACLAHHGRRCAACGLDMGERYGPIAEGFIHVHHIRAISDIGQEYKVDPVRDLVPVCPNCHAVLHLRQVPLTIAELRSLIQSQP